MGGKREKPEDIVMKLRQVEVLQGQGKPLDLSRFSAAPRVNFVAVPGHWGTLPLSMKGALNGTTSKNIYRRFQGRRR